jgi:hypothetical protein
MGVGAFCSQAASLGGSENAAKITKRVSRETIPITRTPLLFKGAENYPNGKES